MNNDPRKGRASIKGKRTERKVSGVITYTLAEAFDLFYSAKQAEGIRERTRADYVRHWRYFTEWVNNIVDINEVTPSLIRDYVNYMSSKTKYSEVPDRIEAGVTLSPFTVALRLRTLRTIFTFLAAEGYISANPVRTVKLPRFDREDKETFTDDDVRKLLATPDTDTFAGLRDRTLMYLLADSGLRINEALRLTTEFIDIKSRCIHLPAWMNKNRKPRVVPLSPEVVRELLALINENKAYFNTEFIFVANYGEPLKADHFRKRLKIHAKRAGVSAELAHPHQFRSYFCTSYMLNGGDIFSLQRIVAHANIETTRGYAKMSDDNIRGQHAQYSPLTKLGISRVVKRK